MSSAFVESDRTSAGCYRDKIAGRRLPWEARVLSKNRGVDHETHPGKPVPTSLLGVTGSGKSSAAHAFAAASGLPEFSADDDIGWLPGWQQRSVEKQRGIAAVISAQDRWVLDSAYGVWRDIVVPWQFDPHMPPVITFRRPRDLDGWLAQVPRAAARPVSAADDFGQP